MPRASGLIVNAVPVDIQAAKKLGSKKPSPHRLMYAGKNRGLGDQWDAVLSNTGTAFSAALSRLTPDQVQSLYTAIQTKIQNETTYYNYVVSQYNYNHYGGQSQSWFNNFQNDAQNMLARLNDQLNTVATALGTTTQVSTPIDKRSLFEIYGGSEDTSVSSPNGGLSQLLCDLDAYQARRNQNMEGFFQDVGKAIAAPFHAFAKILPTPLRTAFRYIGASNVLTPWGILLPASTRARMFGLSPAESKSFETVAKVERGVAAAVAVGATAYTLAAPAVAPSASQVTAGAAVLGATKGLLPAGQGVMAPQEEPPLPNFNVTGPVKSWLTDVDTGLPLNPDTGQALYSKADVAAVQAASDNWLGNIKNGVATGWSSAKDVTASGAQTILNALKTTTAIVSAGNDLILLTKGPQGQINANQYDKSQISGASSLKDGYAYPGVGGGGSWGGGSLMPSQAGDGSSQSALDLSGIGMGGPATGPNAPGVKTQGSNLPVVVGLGTLALAAYFYYNPKQFAKVKSKVKEGFDAVKGKVISWAS